MVDASNSFGRRWLCQKLNRTFRIGLVLLAGITSSVNAQNGSEASSSGDYFIIDRSEYTGDESLALQLSTPQSAIEFFLQAANTGNIQAASALVNRSLIDQRSTPPNTQELVQILDYLLSRELGIDWEALPDRADGLSQVPSSPQDPMVGKTRKSITVGSLSIDGKDYAIRLQRVKPGDLEPLWMFSPRTAVNALPLYEQFGPGKIDRIMPDWAKQQVFGLTPLWAWVALALMIVLALILGLWIKRLVTRFIKDLDGGWTIDLAKNTAGPAALLGATVFVYILSTVTLSMPRIVGTSLLIVLILALTWTGMRVISTFVDYIANQHMEDVSDLAGDDTAEDQRMLTILSVGRRIALFIMVVIAFGIIIAQFQSLQLLGLSLMASAGVATVILGIAAQPVLGHIIASLQIAISQPVCIGDSVVYSGEWGYVEDITYTYVLIRTWDKRRLVVPLRHLITHPFENWTIRDAHLIKPIKLYADYRVDVQAVRDYFDEILREDEDWDETGDPVLQVTKLTDETVELRALCSAADASTAWSLHCRLREKMLEFLRQGDGSGDGASWLPRTRVEMPEQSLSDQLSPQPARR